MVNITKLTESYIAEHPFVKDCLKKGIINYSSLTRQICSDLNLDIKKNFDAILIACRRFYRKIKTEAATEKKIFHFIEKSIGNVDAVIVSDYAKGTITKTLMEKLVALCREKNRVIISLNKQSILLKKIQNILWGSEKAKIIIEDKTGNSAIISDNAVKEKLKK